MKLPVQITRARCSRSTLLAGEQLRQNETRVNGSNMDHRCSMCAGIQVWEMC